MPLVKDLADLFISKLKVYAHAKIMTLNLRNLHSVQIHIFSSALLYAIFFFFFLMRSKILLMKRKRNSN